MFGVWHAGLAAVPANAKLHGRELGYILQHSGARVCFASSELVGSITAHVQSTLEHLIEIGGVEYKALFTADPIASWPCQGDDLAWLFYTSGTTGRPKGAMLTHRVLAAASYAYAGEVDPITPGDVLLHAAPMSHGFETIHDGARRSNWHQRRAGIQFIRCRGGAWPVRCLAARLDVCGTHDGQADGRMRCGMQSGSHQDHHLGRRTDVCCRCPRCHRPVWRALCADLRPGREPDDDYDAVEAGDRRPRSSALG